MSDPPDPQQQHQQWHQQQQQQQQQYPQHPQQQPTAMYHQAAHYPQAHGPPGMSMAPPLRQQQPCASPYSSSYPQPQRPQAQAPTWQQQQQWQQQQWQQPQQQHQPWPGRGGGGGGARAWGGNGGGGGGGRGYAAGPSNGNGGRNGGRGGRGGPPNRRPPRWIATPATAQEVAADPDATPTAASPVVAFWLDPLPRSGDDAAFRAARAALRASAGQSNPHNADDRVVYVLRGLPGAGKSTRAASLRAAHEQRGHSCPVHSTDDLSLCPVSGEYLFQQERLSELHDANFARFERSLEQGAVAAIVDNTNLLRWNYERYVVAAWRRGYRVREERVGEFTVERVEGYAQRNLHGVPRERVEAMLEGFLKEEREVEQGGGGVAAPAHRRGW